MSYFPETRPGTIEEKKSFLLRHHIAAWDVILPALVNKLKMNG